MSEDSGGPFRAALFLSNLSKSAESARLTGPVARFTVNPLGRKA